MPSEASIVAGIVRVAESHGWLPVRMQRAGFPALLCLKEGKAMWFHPCKAGASPTPAQARRMDSLRRQGGCLCFVVTGAVEADMALANLRAFVPPNQRRTATDPTAARCERRSVCRRCPR